MALIKGLCKYRLVWAFIAILCVRGYAQNSIPVLESAHGSNAPAQENNPYVVLVSLDGFRYNYAARHGAKNLQALGSEGATAPDEMIPAYPSLTFPIIIRS